MFSNGPKRNVWTEPAGGFELVASIADRAIVLLPPPGPLGVQLSRPPGPSTDTQSTPLSPALTQALAKALALAVQTNQTPASPAPAPAAPLVAPTPSDGLGKVTRVSGTTVTTTAGAKEGTKDTSTAVCPDPRTLVGGGALVTTNDGQNSNEAQLSASYASDAKTWTAVAVVADGNLSQNETLSVTAVALCSM
jgi:hypothetical protein